MYFLVKKMTEKFILITLLHKNTQYFLIFLFFKIFRGQNFAPSYDAAPRYDV